MRGFVAESGVEEVCLEYFPSTSGCNLGRISEQMREVAADIWR